MNPMLMTVAVLMLQSPATAVRPSPISAYSTVQQRIDVGRGRAMALACVGSGKQTVLFDSGGSDWSVIWTTILPKMAGFARACAYDRAGLGTSDPGPGARTPTAIADDMHSMIKAAGLTTPLVLVGHSLGGFNVKLYAVLYPEDVAGVVLIDPAEERTWDRTRAWAIRTYGHHVAAKSELTDHAFINGLAERYRRCAALAQPSGLIPESVEYRRCSDPPRPQLGEEVNAERRRVHATAAYQAAQASEIAYSVYADNRADAAYAHLFRPGLLGSRPFIVLTHEEENSTDPVDQLSNSQGLMLHRETARLSTRGKHQVVPNSGHYIQLDQPDIVIRAINAVIRELH
jgi:pimeloyl-ACP methyl ester carboxylesterase